MTKIKKTLLGFILITFLHSCGSLSDASKVLKNEKIKNTDEFLVKKRDELSLPPDFRTMPTPNSITKKNKKKKRDRSIKPNNQKYRTKYIYNIRLFKSWRIDYEKYS